MKLIIVESPTKAKTLTKFLNKEFSITASMGHIRDLPKSKLGVDVEHNFEPKYIVSRDKLKKVKELKEQAARAKEVILATDPDREGEAIAWHLEFLLKNENKDLQVSRIVFHEITETAIKEALAHPGQIDLKLVDAQQARRVLDRLVGYKLSPLLWKKIQKGLSAGRVQSVAVRLIVQREREIDAFRREEFWKITGVFEENPSFKAELVKIHNEKPVIDNEDEAKKLVQLLTDNQNYKVLSFEKKQTKRSPYPPFTTSTLQQAGSNLFGWGAKKTMQVAQKLYELGAITYMRTDSLNLAEEAVAKARDEIVKSFGKEYLPEKPRLYKTKSKNAQEAHEAIRPTKIEQEAKDFTGELDLDQQKLYTLIRSRMLACQMSDAVYDQKVVQIENDIEQKKYIFRGNSAILVFQGWKVIWGEADELEEKNPIPDLLESQRVKLTDIFPTQHFTEPPPRFTEASLIKTLEELGIGRPSTYAPTITTIIDRQYIEKEQKKLKPTALGATVNDFLMKHFADILDYQFTAQVENQLDEIADGKFQWQKVVGDFFQPFDQKVLAVMETAEKIKMDYGETSEVCEKCGKPMVVKMGRFGKFLACSGFPECKNAKSFKEEIGLTCPKCKGAVVLKKTRKGKTFYGCVNYPTCTFAAWKKEEVLKNKTSQVLGGEEND